MDRFRERFMLAVRFAMWEGSLPRAYRYPVGTKTLRVNITLTVR